MNDQEGKAIIEALLFVCGDPVSFDRLHDVVGIERERLMFLVLELKKEYEQAERGLAIVEIAGGYQMITRPEVGAWVKEMEKGKVTARLTRPGLETLAVIAYKQPVTRAEIEMIRGVDAAGVLKTLMERKLIRMLGRKEVPGRPMMYGTTRQFLQYFGLPDLAALPTLKEFAELLPTPADELSLLPEPAAEAETPMPETLPVDTEGEPVETPPS